MRNLLPLVFLGVLVASAFSHDDLHMKERKAYVVYMGKPRHGVSHIDAAQNHHDMLASLLHSEELAREVRFRSYGKSFDGFAAHLLPREVERLRGNPKVVSVFPDKKRPLVTTRSWDYIGVTETIKRNIRVESDLIVAVLDTGIYIDAPAFDDKGFGPPPKKWKGICQTGANFTGCNNKVIGARTYDRSHPLRDPPSPLDTAGHGTHTASTVAGMPVLDASLYGIGKGTARGGVPSARLAIYKVCSYGEGCDDSDMLAGFDDAIHDGVDVISISIGGPIGEYFQDSISIGAYHAMERGILTSAAAGNDRGVVGSVTNVAPWMLTVGATGSDRQYKTTIGLGNGRNYSGVSINTFNPTKKVYPLTSGFIAQNASSVDAQLSPGYCSEGAILPEKVKGKIVVCNGDSNGATLIDELGGVGLVSLDEDDLGPWTGFEFVIPTSLVNNVTLSSILNYIHSTKNPEAVIYQSEPVIVEAPFVAGFSSVGPNILSRTVLKPDIGAPGVNILASYSKVPALVEDAMDKRHPMYNIVSGTSMATPHASAVAIYIKSFHPNWSPAAIKSAIMTTASRIKVKHKMAEYAYGSGQIDPVKALDPGLVYDMSPKDYIRFLCKEGYTGSRMNMVSGHDATCPPNSVHVGGHDGVNYPSMNVQLDPESTRNKSSMFVFHRIVTNVGPLGNATYTALVSVPKGVKVIVTPRTLRFSRVYEKRSFRMIVTVPPATRMATHDVISGSLEWSDGLGHNVRSPIVVSLAMAAEGGLFG